MDVCVKCADKSHMSKGFGEQSCRPEMPKSVNAEFWVKGCGVQGHVHRSKNQAFKKSDILLRPSLTVAGRNFN